MKRPPERAMMLAIGFAGPLVFAALSLYFGMDASWDTRNYHYYNGFAAVHGLLDYNILPAQRPTFFNPLLDAPYYLLLANAPARLAGAVLGAIHGLNFTLLFGLSRRTLAPAATERSLATAFVIAAVGVAGGMGLSLVGTGFHDNVVSLGVLLSLLLLSPAPLQPSLIDIPSARALLRALLAGLPTGIAAAAKQPMVIYAIGLCLAFLFAGGPLARRFWLAVAFGLGVSAGVLIAGGPWMLHLWHAFGNPLMPFFNDIFRSPMAELKDYRDVQFVPKSVWQALFFPIAYFRDPALTSEAAFRDVHILLAWIATPLALGWTAWAALARRPRLPRRSGQWALTYLLVAAAVSYVLWLLLFGIYRYALTLEMLGPLLVAAALVRLPLPKNARSGLMVLALLVMVGLTRPAAWERVPWAATYVDVHVPALRDPAHTMVLMTGYQPTSFAIPSFPPGVRFVRIMSNYTHPFETANGFNDLMKSLVARHRGPLYSLFVEWDSWHNNQGLEIYGLSWDRARCQNLTGTIVVAPILLCPVTRR